MIQDYLILANRIRQELKDLQRTIMRASRAVSGAKRHPEDEDLYMDSAALNLHDFYVGLERVYQQIGATVDRYVPTGKDWHRELLQQMETEVPDLRPPVLTASTMQTIDEFLRFRHVVRNIYAFEFDPVRIARLVNMMHAAFEDIQGELLVFATFLEQVGK